MPVRVHIYLAAKLMDLLDVFVEERTDAARQNVYNGVGNVVLLYVCNTVFQRIRVIKNSLCGADGLAEHIEAMGVVIGEFPHLFCLVHCACHVIFDLRLILVILCQLIHKCFISPVRTGNAF